MDNRLTKFSICTVAFLLGICSGCSQQEQENGPGGAGDGHPVALRIGGVSAGGIVTRSQNTLLEDPGDKIGLFLQGSADYNPIRNREFTYDSPFWTSADGLVMLTEQPAVLAASYPYREGQTTTQELRTQEYDLRDDFLYCRFSANKRDASVVLNMKRAYARLCFRLSPQTGDNAYTGEGKTDEFRFTANGVVLRARNAADGLHLRLRQKPGQEVHGGRSPGGSLPCRAHRADGRHHRGSRDRRQAREYKRFSHTPLRSDGADGAGHKL